MQNFAAIDFETANGQRSSICSVGLVVVSDGEIVERVHRLIHPTPNYYYRYFTEQIHGISEADTHDAPRFPEVWENEIAPLIEGLPLVAHNAPFDEGALRAAQQLMTPLLRPILGVPGNTGLALITDLQSTDAGAALTKGLADTGLITKQNLVVMCAWQYAGAGLINNYFSNYAGKNTHKKGMPPYF